MNTKDAKSLPSSRQKRRLNNMLKFIKGLMAGIKKFFGGIFSAVLKGASALGGKKKARPADVGGQAKPPEQK